MKRESDQNEEDKFDQEIKIKKVESLLVINFGVKKEQEIKIAGFDMVCTFCMSKINDRMTL